jgi:hypothetical protein
VPDGLSSPQHANQYSGGAEPCEACAIARSGAAACADDPSLTGANVAIDSDVVVISGPRIVGQVVVPHQHVSGLEELPPPRRALVLAAIRRAAVAVGGGTSESQAQIVVSTESPASPSHVSFRVLPPDYSET